MPVFLNTLGRSTLGIGICDRCKFKFPLEELQPDPNIPGLRVCAKDADQFDPWRLPALQDDRLVLPFVRPDESIALQLSDLNIPETDYRITEDEAFRITDNDEFRILEESQSSGAGTYTTSATFMISTGPLTYTRYDALAPTLDTDLWQFAPPAAQDPWSFPGVVRYYVDPDTGSDANNGLSWATAFATVDFALSRPDVDVVIVRATTYKLDGVQQGMGLYTGSRDIVLATEEQGRTAQFTCAIATAWAPYLANPNVYESDALGGTAVDVLDTGQVNDVNDYLSLTPVATITDVENTPGSWTQTGGRVYVRLLYDRVPDTSIWPLRLLFQRVQAPGVRFFVRDIHFIGGTGGALSVREGDADTVVFAMNCAYTNCPNGDGFDVSSQGLMINVNCRASSNFNDGFNYHEDSAFLSCSAIEVNCQGIGNLAVGDGQGSSAHEATKIFRINGLYQQNNGPGIVDINSVQSFNVGCVCRVNIGNPDPSLRGGGYMFSNTVQAWLDACVSYNNVQPNALVAYNSALVHMRDEQFFGQSVAALNSAVIDSNFS